MSVGAAVRAWKLRAAAGKLRAAERELKDAIYRRDQWAFADSPSRFDDRMQEIYALIRKVEALGGDAQECVRAGTKSIYSLEYLLEEAMPEVFERVRNRSGNGWTTQRRTETAA